MRMPIITLVNYNEDSVIKKAISFEVERGGQVFFVHNNIKNIEILTRHIQEMFPSLNIIFIHGQEAPKTIEKKMHLFCSLGIDVLVCTSIIGAGIDVPNANCIIINNSHLFGLSQLYQMRGRVGRGYRQAYAYLLIPRGVRLSTVAHGRIKAIEENTRLGSGYNISRSDMEIRGSGSVFGYKQAGGSESVGYEMYLRLVRRALHESDHLDKDFFVMPEDVSVEIYSQRFIPEEYISFESLRFSFYKNLASTQGASEIDRLVFNLIDRFGALPLPVKNLVYESRIRLLAASAGFDSVVLRGCGVVCRFVKNNNPELLDAYFNFIEQFFCNEGVDYHIVPGAPDSLLICVHILDMTDKYSLLSCFLDKFKALN